MLNFVTKKYTNERDIDLGKDYWGSNINYNVKKLILDYVFSFLNTVYFDV